MGLQRRAWQLLGCRAGPKTEDQFVLSCYIHVYYIYIYTLNACTQCCNSSISQMCMGMEGFRGIRVGETFTVNMERRWGHKRQPTVHTSTILCLIGASLQGFYFCGFVAFLGGADWTSLCLRNECSGRTIRITVQDKPLLSQAGRGASRGDPSQRSQLHRIWQCHRSLSTSIYPILSYPVPHSPALS